MHFMETFRKQKGNLMFPMKRIKGFGRDRKRLHTAGVRFFILPCFSEAWNKHFHYQHFQHPVSGT